MMLGFRLKPVQAQLLNGLKTYQKLVLLLIQINEAA